MASLLCLFHPLTFSDIEQIIAQVRAFKKQKVEQEENKKAKMKTVFRLSQQCI
jgi:hypothetical protein